MFKKIAVLVFALLYLVTVNGFALNLHYCFNHVASVKINAPAKSCTTTAAKMKCCKDKHIDVKVKDAHESCAASFLAKFFLSYLPKTLFYELPFYNPDKFAALAFNKPLPHPPPDKLILQKNCVLLI